MNAEVAREAACLAHVHHGLRMVSVTLPHLAGLAGLVRIRVDPRVETAGVFRSGLMMVHPDWFLALSLPDATFVLAHELLHLALRTHDRAAAQDPHTFNCAHDYIINDLLCHELGLSTVPAGGLVLEGARTLSVEALYLQIRDGEIPAQDRAWEPGTPRELVEQAPPEQTALAAALRAAGFLDGEDDDGAQGATEPHLDLLPDALEEEWFGDSGAAAHAAEVDVVAAAGLRALEIRAAMDLVEDLPWPGQGSAVGREGCYVEALRTSRRPPWEGALQRWMENVTPGPRSYARPSRRGADRADLVLPGRRREGWTLHVVLDTSGSMGTEHRRVLGALASFCEATLVETIHLLQCDTRVTTDEWLTPAELHRYRVAGYGGSDMTPALRALEADPEVEAVMVLTDGHIDFPREPLPYEVLWVLTGRVRDFRPGYGQVLRRQESPRTRRRG